MTLKTWPPSERPREKLLNAGAETLSDAELLAIFLNKGMRGKTAVDLGRDLLHHFHGLRPLFDADLAELATLPGIGPAKSAILKAVTEISRRYFKEQLIREGCLTNPGRAGEYLRAQLRHCTRETFACLFLDNRHQIIKFETLFEGTINQASIHPREVVKRTLALNACAVIFAHNHPSGHPQPSEADRVLTDRLIQCLALFEIRVLDHFIIADNRIVSMAKLGHI